MKKLDILLAGVGGQGIILCSDIIGAAAIVARYDVKKTDTLGMAQRGGSVVSNVRLGQRVFSPLIPEGAVDLLVAFEKLEAASWGHYLRPEGVAVVNNHAIPPLSVSLGSEKYPSDGEVKEILGRRTSHVFFMDGTRRARELGDARVISMFMLGCASVFLPIRVQVWRETISKSVPEKFQRLNLAAFDLARKEMRNVVSFDTRTVKVVT